MRNRFLTYFVISSFMVSVSFLAKDAQAKIYKCVNVNEEVFYNDKPCSVTEIESQMKAVKDPKNGYISAPILPPVEAEGMQKHDGNDLEIVENSLNEDTSSIKPSMHQALLIFIFVAL